MKKNLLCLLMAAVIVLSMLPAGVFAGRQDAAVTDAKAELRDCELNLGIADSLRIAPPADTKVRLSGDVNGDGEVSVSDVLLLMRYLIGSEALDEEMLNQWCDLDGDGAVTLMDALLILRIAMEPDDVLTPPVVTVYAYGKNLSNQSRVSFSTDMPPYCSA